MLTGTELEAPARAVADRCLLIDEFLADEERGEDLELRLDTDDGREVLFHGHCQQKAEADPERSLELLRRAGSGRPRARPKKLRAQRGHSRWTSSTVAATARTAASEKSVTAAAKRARTSRAASSASGASTASTTAPATTKTQAMARTSWAVG